jgi:cell division protein ZapE
MILGRLFEALFSRGVVIVATSNVRPDLLYQDGLNRTLFLPFIAMIEERMQIIRLDARGDFRLRKLRDHAVYFVPPDACAAAALTAAFKVLTGAEHGAPMTIEVLGHPVHVPEACANVARFSFADVCGTALGPADFLALARRFHTVVLDAIPVIGAGQRDEAKRFIMLIDTFYDRHVKLLASAEAEPAERFMRAAKGSWLLSSSGPRRASSKCARWIISPCRTARLRPWAPAMRQASWKPKPARGAAHGQGNKRRVRLPTNLNNYRLTPVGS